MTHPNKLFTLISAALAVIFLSGWYIRLEKWPDNLAFYFVLIMALAIPILISQVLLLFFHNRQNPNQLQWLPNVLSVLSIVCLLGIQVWNFDELSGYQMRDIEQRRIEKAIRRWIKDNAEKPSTYQNISFSEHTQTVFPRTEFMNEENEYPIRYLIKDYNMKFEYAYYFIRHIFLLKNKDGIIDTVHASFQLTPNLNVTNVRLPEDRRVLNDLTHTGYAWRNRYGNEKRNLELELHGNDNIEYYYRRFSEDGVLERLIPYSNSTINGSVYYLSPHRDTSAIITYKNGVRNGYVIEQFDGVIRFKGITRNGKHHGLATFYHSNEKKESQGFRYNNMEVGEWKYWDENGKLIRTKDFGHHDLLKEFTTEITQ